MEYSRIKSCADYIKSKTDFVPEVAVVLGSGLGDFAELVDMTAEIKYSEIEGAPVSTVSGHEGRFVLGELEGRRVIVMQGRVHYYEGYPMNDVVLPIRVMHELGAQELILTNAAGGINRCFQAGDLMLITDHISSLMPSSLAGANIDELGTRFPDMSEVYSIRLQDKAKEAALKLQIDLKQGVYIQTSGPNYETPAEIRMFATCGADAVGMSTACEAMAARHMGMEICGISCITNMASGISKTELNHKEVGETAKKAAANFQNLLREILKA